MLTLVPWRGRAIVGTGQSTTLVAAWRNGGHGEPKSTRSSPTPTSAFPALRADARRRHARASRDCSCGRERGKGGPDCCRSRPILDHASEGAAGAITVVGVKYTTARARRAGRRRPRRPKRLGEAAAGRRGPATTTLPGAGIADHEALAIETARECGLELPLPTIRHLIALYAERAADIVRLMHERPRSARAARHRDCDDARRRGRPRHPARDGLPLDRHRHSPDGPWIDRDAGRSGAARLRRCRRPRARLG